MLGSDIILSPQRGMVSEQVLRSWPASVLSFSINQPFFLFPFFLSTSNSSLLFFSFPLSFPFRCGLCCDFISHTPAQDSSVKLIESPMEMQILRIHMQCKGLKACKDNFVRYVAEVQSEVKLNFLVCAVSCTIGVLRYCCWQELIAQLDRFS